MNGDHIFLNSYNAVNRNGKKMNQNGKHLICTVQMIVNKLKKKTLFFTNKTTQTFYSGKQALIKRVD